MFRIAVVKDGPDVKLFRNPGALTKLALWIAEAIRVQEKERGDSVKLGQKGAAGTPLVLAGLDEDRHLYVVVGTGGGGGVVDFAAIAKRQEERKKKKDVKEKKQKERSERRSQRAAERAEREEEIGAKTKNQKSPSPHQNRSPRTRKIRVEASSPQPIWYCLPGGSPGDECACAHRQFRALCCQGPEG